MHLRHHRATSVSRTVAAAVAFTGTLVLCAPAFAATDDRLALYVSTFRLSGDQPLAIRTVQADGAEPRDIDAPRSFLSDNRWSPDASEIASVEMPRSEMSEDAPRSLRVSAQDGSAQRTLASDVAPYRVVSPLTWTNDGSHLGYISGPQVDTRLSLVRRDGSARAVIDTGRHDMQVLQWSPDGGLVTFTSQTPEGAVGLFAITPEGDGLRLIADQSGVPQVPTGVSWSPDGDRFIYLRNAPEQSYLPRIVRRDGTVERDFPIQHGYPSVPSWAPDGERIAMLHLDRDENAEPRGFSIVLADPDSGAERPLGFEPPDDHTISGPGNWSPDSRHLLVHTRRPSPSVSTPHLWLVDVETGEGRELTLDARASLGSGAFAPLPTTPPATRSTASACPEGQVPDAGFTDTAGSTFTREIDCVAWYDIARGTTATTYSPERTVTRVQMARFLTRIAERAGIELDTSDAGFEDLDGLDPDARDAVNAVANLGVAQGASATTFVPAQSVTRGQMASFLFRLHTAISGEELGPRVHCFSDVSTSVHRAAAERLCGAGVASGVARGSYVPGAAVTRAQMAGFLARLLDIHVASGTIPRP